MLVVDGTAIRRARKIRRWSQRELAGLCKRSQNAIHLVETNPGQTIGETFAMSLCYWLLLDPEATFADLPPSFADAARSNACTTADRESA